MSLKPKSRVQDNGRHPSTKRRWEFPDKALTTDIDSHILEALRELFASFFEVVEGLVNFDTLRSIYFFQINHVIEVPDAGRRNS
jgi:hypothetical protein